MMNAPRLCTASLPARICAVVVILVAGALLYPRPPADVSPSRVIAEALAANTQAPVGQVQRAMNEGCTPILEGSDTLSGREAWPIRLKPPHRRYPWLEVWVDKKTSTILAYKEWGIRNDRATVLRQSPNP